MGSFQFQSVVCFKTAAKTGESRFNLVSLSIVMTNLLLFMGTICIDVKLINSRQIPECRRSEMSINSEHSINTKNGFSMV